MVMHSAAATSSLISVIITTSNQFSELKNTVESSASQSWRNIEILIVDCGEENLFDVVASLTAEVKYFHKPAAGLSAARNFGMQQSLGRYLVFLNSGDWLYEDGLQVNAQFLQRHKKIAFISGSHHKVNESDNIVDIGQNIVLNNHYQHLLQGNYIEMHGTVMYQRWVFDQYLFDDNIESDSEYDLFLRISRNHPVHHHHRYTAIQRICRTPGIKEMQVKLKSVQYILKRQRKKLQSPLEKQCLKNGLQIWQSYWSEEIFRTCLSHPKLLLMEHHREMWLLFKCRPVQAIKLFIHKW